MVGTEGGAVVQGEIGLLWHIMNVVIATQRLATQISTDEYQGFFMNSPGDEEKGNETITTSWIREVLIQVAAGRQA